MGRLQSDPNISSIRTSTMITRSNSGCPIKCTAFYFTPCPVPSCPAYGRLRIPTTFPPHPVQANRQPASHRYFGNTLLPTHRQVREIQTIPAEKSGTGKETVVTDEYWYSDDVRINIMIKHNDPRTGTTTLTVTQHPACLRFRRFCTHTQLVVFRFTTRC